MRLNILVLDIFSVVLRKDKRTLIDIGERLENNISSGFLIDILKKEKEVLAEMDHIISIFESEDEEIQVKKDRLLDKYDKELVVVLRDKIKKDGISKVMTRFDKEALNQLLYAFFKKYFYYKARFKVEMNK